MKKTKRNVVLMVIASLFIISFLITPKQIKAVSDEYVQKIETNASVEGVLESTSEVKYYKFTMDKTGYFQIAFSVPEIGVDTKDGWTVSLLDSDGNATIYSFNISGNYALPKTGFEKGKTFYIKIETKYNSNIWAPLGVKYQFQVNTYENTNWEVENNDSSTKANNIDANIDYCANLNSSNDVDYYHFVMDRTGYFDITFSIPEVDAKIKDGWNVTVFAEDSEVNSFVATSNVTTRPYAFKQGTNIFVKVESRYHDSNYAPTYTEYNLKINATTSALWEQESNDSMQEASSINLKETYSGTTYITGDVDYYKVQITGKGFVTIFLDSNDLSENLGDGYDLSVYNSSNAKLYSNTCITSKSNAKLYLSPGAYYLRIEDHNKYSSPSVYSVYKLRADFALAAKPGKVAIKSVKGTTYKYYFSTFDNISYRLKSVKNVSGYQIQISTNKKFNKNKTTVFSADIKGTIGSELVKKKKYYIRARAYYETPLGAKTYGKWSNIKYVKTK